MFKPVYIDCPCPCKSSCKCTPCGLDELGGKCFPAEAQIQLDTDETIQVKDLRAGHRVLAGKCNYNGYEL